MAQNDTGTESPSDPALRDAVEAFHSRIKTNGDFYRCAALIVGSQALARDRKVITQKQTKMKNRRLKPTTRHTEED